MNTTPQLRMRARTICQLGEQLIKNESIALLEIIKNAYDADASECSVVMKKIALPDEGQIIITDNGEGMDYLTLSTVWLEIGTSFKEELSKNDETRLTKKYHRLRLGEKGIGRFGVHRLGRKIEIVSRKEGETFENTLNINWDNIEQAKYIEELPVAMSRQKPTTFAAGHGTQIIISKLRSPWTRKMARDCARSITALNSPFDEIGNFRVSLDIINSNWLDSLMSFNDIAEYKLFFFDIRLAGKEIVDFSYEFTPWATMKKLKPRQVTISDKEIAPLTRMQKKVGSEYRDINLSKYKIGEIRFKGYIFDREARILALGIQDKKGLKEYLDFNGGIRVFRDNLRVLDYGELGNDWLDLGGRRVNIPAKRISNNIILGAVNINRADSTDLVEKANREGFLENDAYNELRDAVLFAIERIETLRKTDKDMLRAAYGLQSTAVPVETSIIELRALVERKILNLTLKKEIDMYLDKIEDEYEKITSGLIKAAGAGLNLVIVIHQIEKIIKEIKHMLKQKADAATVESRISTLSKLVEGYSILVSNSEKKNRNLRTIIEQCLFNLGFRLTAHKIELVLAFRGKEMPRALCSEDHVLNALMNLIDNSIWWLGYSKTRTPSIYIDVSDQLEGYMSIIVADNGPGFHLAADEMIQPFVSSKPGGMGIGLSLTNEIMKSLGGKLLFPGIDIFDIPQRFAKGAIIALAFKRGDM